MHAAPCWIAAILAADIVAAAAASPVPLSQMPGRERDRFTPSPVERFTGPGPYVSAPVLTPPEEKCPGLRHTKSRSRRSKNC